MFDSAGRLIPVPGSVDYRQGPPAIWAAAPAVTNTVGWAAPGHNVPPSIPGYTGGTFVRVDESGRLVPVYSPWLSSSTPQCFSGMPVSYPPGVPPHHMIPYAHYYNAHASQPGVVQPPPEGPMPWSGSKVALIAAVSLVLLLNFFVIAYISVLR